MNFDLNRLDGKKVNLYRAAGEGAENVVKIGKFVLHIDGDSVSCLSDMPANVQFAEPVLCKCYDVVKVCRENPRGPNQYAFSLNMESAGIKQMLFFSTVVGDVPLLEIQLKQAQDADNAVFTLRWHDVSAAMQQELDFCNDLLE